MSNSAEIVSVAVPGPSGGGDCVAGEGEVREMREPVPENVADAAAESEVIVDEGGLRRSKRRRRYPAHLADVADVAADEDDWDEGDGEPLPPKTASLAVKAVINWKKFKSNLKTSGKIRVSNLCNLCYLSLR